SQSTGLVTRIGLQTVWYCKRVSKPLLRSPRRGHARGSRARGALIILATPPSN
ncbi:hypothetical protein GGI08_005447, partial [Coemansia sp. S2]